MHLVVHQVVELQEVHDADGDAVFKLLAGTAVVQDGLSVRVEAGLEHQLVDFFLAGAVEDGRGHVHAQFAGRAAQMDLQHLAQVHTGGNAQRVQHDVQRRAVGQEGHVLFAQDAGNDALVAVTAGHLVAHGDLALLGDVDAHHHVDAGGQFVLVFPGKDLDVDDDAALAVRHLQGGVADLAGLFAEDGAQQALFRGQLGFALGGHLAHQDIARTDFRADADDAVFVQVTHGVFADVGDVPGDFFRAQLGFPGFGLVFLDVDGGVLVLPDQALAQQNGVLIVVAFPGHETDQHVLAQTDFTLFGGRTVRQQVARLDALAEADPRALVDAGALVGAGEFDQMIFMLGADVVADDDLVGVHIGHGTGVLGEQHHARVMGGLVFHTGADDRGFGHQQRHGLTLHVAAHQGAVCVVILQEGDHGGGNGDDLLGADVQVIHLVAGNLAGIVLPTDDHLGVDEAAVLVEGLLGLADHVAVFFVRRHVDDLVGDAVGFLVHLAVGGFDEAVFVDPRIGRQRADQTDVRAFRRLDGADAGIMAVVNVADLHARAVAVQTAGAQGGQTALVGQLR